MCQTRREHGKEKCNSKAISYKLLLQGLEESRVRFNDIGNQLQYSALNEGILKLSEQNSIIQEQIKTDIESVKAEERKAFLVFEFQLD